MKILLPFSWLYALVVSLRNKAFDRGMLKSERAGVPVISVGNLTTGGTGKTPLVESIVKRLLKDGKRVAVVSRGYKRKSSGVVVVSDGNRLLADGITGGDEPVQMALRFPGAVVVVGEERVDAAREAVRLGAEVIVMDDGFQHRYLARDLDVVVVDATSDIVNDAVLPAGRLREPLSGLRRADVVAFSRCDDVDRAGFSLDTQLRRYFSGPFIRYRSVMREVRRGTDDAVVSADAVKRMNLVAFSGIGNHKAFISALGRDGFGSLVDLKFADHHVFSESDIAMLGSFVRGMHADACVTTEKDIVRLRSDKSLAEIFFREVTVFYVTIEVEILEGEEILSGMIHNCMGGKPDNGHRPY